MRAPLTALTIVPIVAAMLLACGHSQPTGVIVGSATPCTGPIAPPTGYVQVVTVGDAHGKVVTTLRLLDNGRSGNERGAARPFRVVVPVGQYHLTAPGDFPGIADVRGHKTAKVTLVPDCL